MPKPKFWHDAPGFPIVYEDKEIRIYKNPSGEIFVEDIYSSVSLRFGHRGRNMGLEFTTSGQVEPRSSVGGMIAWEITRRR